MNMRVLVCGVLGGFLAALTLSLPLYHVLPAFYVRSWPSQILPGWEVLGEIGYLLTLLVGLGTGYVAARWGWASSAGDRVRAGALAGVLAGLVAFSLIGAPAAGVLGSEDVLLHGPRPAGQDRETIDREAVRIVCEAVVGIPWWVSLIFWAMFAGGAVLGGTGGWIHARQKSEAWGATPPTFALETVDASVAYLVMGALQLVVCIAAITALRTNAERSVDKYGFQLRFPTYGIAEWVIGMNLLVLIVASWFCGRWCALRWAHPVAGVRKTARLGVYAMVLVPVLALAAVLNANPAKFLDPSFVLLTLGWIAVTYWWIQRIRRAPAAADAAALPSPSLRDRLLINLGLLAVLVPAISWVGGVSQAVSLALGIVMYIAVLFGHSTARSDLPDVGNTIQQIYMLHFIGSFFMAGFWVVLAGSHTAVILGWQAWRRKRLPPAKEEAGADDASAKHG